jgi:hypothetical protein
MPQHNINRLHSLIAQSNLLGDVYGIKSMESRFKEQNAVRSTGQSIKLPNFLMVQERQEIPLESGTKWGHKLICMITSICLWINDILVPSNLNYFWSHLHGIKNSRMAKGGCKMLRKRQWETDVKRSTGDVWFCHFPTLQPKWLHVLFSSVMIMKTQYEESKRKTPIGTLSVRLLFGDPISNL